MDNPAYYSVFVRFPPDSTDRLAVHVIESESDDELRVEESGALRIFDMGGESFIYAPGTWTSVRVRPEGVPDD